MRVLFVPFGSEGDLNPLLFVADGLAARGHTPVFLCTPHYRRPLERRGFEWHPVGTEEDFSRFARDPRIWESSTGPQYIIQGMTEAFEEIRRAFATASAPGADLVITSTLGLAAAAMAQSRGIPWITMHLQPSVLRSVHDCPYFIDQLGWLLKSPRWVRSFFFQIVDIVIWRLAAQRPLNAFRRSLGLPPLRHFYQEALNGADGVAAMFPAWFAAAQRDWPEQARQFDFPIAPVPGELPEELTAYLRSGPPPLVWTHGSANFDIEHFQACALRASAALGERCLLVSLDRPSSPLPRGAFHASHIPFELLFPHCRLAVHHGGIGTTAKCIAASLPQLIIPRAHDQPDNAYRIEKLGLGSRLHYSKLDSPALEATLRATLDSLEIRQNCQTFSKNFAPDGRIGEICQWIEETAARNNASKPQKAS